ncbi:hypothetical protein H6P81_000490 [Aristolochia fimbriata]|uniref:Uncharacterized protein n=1 Tax=Aristolochia fimbriata TaxID=158543 RepID=A0AAV7F7L2_ARIFI|nr:hypothetical protein H6P81_000490 [Aristolochia fimbriata]
MEGEARSLNTKMSLLLGISARRRARLRKEVLLAGGDWPYDPPRGVMRNKRKGRKCDRIAAEKRANTAEFMKKMPEMLLNYKICWDHHLFALGLPNFIPFKQA